MAEKCYFCGMRMKLLNHKDRKSGLRRVMGLALIVGILYSCASVGRIEGWA